MPLSGHRQWRIQNQYQGLNEYNLVKHTSPSGIYLSLTPGNFCLWSGVLFIQTGPYAPGILRFQLTLPQHYPAVPPRIVFTSDIFHPLITPLTTYTYSTSTPASHTVSSGDDERLLPGGVSLRHGFPAWFNPKSCEPMFKDIDRVKIQAGSSSSPPTTIPARRPLSFHIPPPKEDAIDETLLHASISEVLHYVKRVFEDEVLLDELPLDGAANPGAWYAWRAHRRKTRPAAKGSGNSNNGSGSGSGIQQSPLQANQSSHQHARTKSDYTLGRGSSPAPGANKTMADWNWDGVWVERVRKGIALSLSDAVLYRGGGGGGGGGDGDDLIRFLDANDAGYADFKEAWSVSDDAVDINTI